MEIQCQEQQGLAGARNQGRYHGHQGRGLATHSPVPQCPSKADPEMVTRFNQDSGSSDKFVAEADLRSSQEVNPQVTIRSGEDDQGQTQPSDCQAGPWWQRRPKVQLASRPTSWGPDQQSPWPGTAVAELETGTAMVSLGQRMKAKLK